MWWGSKGSVVFYGRGGGSDSEREAGYWVLVAGKNEGEEWHFPKTPQMAEHALKASVTRLLDRNDSTRRVIVDSVVEWFAGSRGEAGAMSQCLEDAFRNYGSPSRSLALASPAKRQRVASPSGSPCPTFHGDERRAGKLPRSGQSSA